VDPKLVVIGKAAALIVIAAPGYDTWTAQ